ncbi:MAG: glycosyltransferase family 4 protein [Planctomycetes bacterium]|nr:glycosyltransferase family 4 protein [Planctomycetota bacterium]
MIITPHASRSITILAARFWPDLYGGVEQRLWETAIGLIEAGMSVQVITENRDGLPPRETPRHGLEITRLPKMNFGRLWRWPDLVRVQWWRRAVKDHAARGTLWACEPSIALGAMLAGRRADVTFNPACCAAGMASVAKAHPFVSTMKMSLLEQLTDRLAYRLAPRVAVSSVNVALQARRHYGRSGDVRVIPHGVHTPASRVSRAAARQAFSLPQASFVIGFVGRLDPCKDLGFLLEAVRRGGLGENGRLLIVGDGPDRERIAALAAEMGVDDYLAWAGKLDDTRTAYAAMDVMVLPSVYEAFGNVIREAMASGVPVIGRRRYNGPPDKPVLTACDELIEHGRTGLLTAPHDPGDLALVLTSLRAQPDELTRMGRNARNEAIAWPWERTVGEYLDLLGMPNTRHFAVAA